ncbi:hypothetical protein CHUAL_013692 [Chamberlinius hualienensis]
MKLFFPDIQDIHFNNLYWQVFVAEDTTFYLFGAYYDCRMSKGGHCYVRILGMVDTISPSSNIKCALWFSGGEKMVWSSSTVNYDHLWNKHWGTEQNQTLQPYLISCLLPKTVLAVPEMVSLISMESIIKHKKPTTNLKVNYLDNGDKKDFVVCVKGMDFPAEDLSWRLLEWVHLLKLIGADKIFFYEFEVHPNVAAVLNYMEANQMAEVIPLTLPGHQPNLQELRSIYLKKMIGRKRLNEIIPYNDCLYRNLYLYKYVVLLDIDEVIMPTSTSSWKALMEQIQSIVELNKPKDYKAASYNVRNVYFFSDLHDAKAEEGIPEHLYMIRHVVRSSEFSKKGRYVKCFHDVSQVKALHNHYPLFCLPGFSCATFDISPLMAQLQHYRFNCQDIDTTECFTKFKNKTVVDVNIWRYKTELEELVMRDIQRLKNVIQ